MVEKLLSSLGVPQAAYTAGSHAVHTPIDGSRIGSVALDTPTMVTAKVGRAHQAFTGWRAVPAARRGELVRLFGEVLRRNKAALGELVSWEAGKISQEGLGEVQEMIDICDFAV